MRGKKSIKGLSMEKTVEKLSQKWEKDAADSNS